MDEYDISFDSSEALLPPVFYDSQIDPFESPEGPILENHSVFLKLSLTKRSIEFQKTYLLSFIFFQFFFFLSIKSGFDFKLK